MSQQQRQAKRGGRRPRRQTNSNNKPSPAAQPSRSYALSFRNIVLVAIVAIGFERAIRLRILYYEKKSVSEEVIVSFITWFKDNGGWISPNVTLAEFPDFGGYGTLADVAVGHNDQLFTTPKSIIISATYVIKHYKSLDPKNNISDQIERVVKNAFYSPLVQQDVIIALHLMAECSLGNSSHMLPYLRLLPADVPRLDTFTSDEEAMDLLQDKHLVQVAKQSANELSAAWQRRGLKDIASQWSHLAITHAGLSEDERQVLSCLTFESFHHFVAVVSSRAMILQGGVKYLTPLADMMNYRPRYDNRTAESSESFSRYHVRDADESITVRADRNVVGGDQIFEDYGDVDNSLFIEAFGFVPDDNPFHCAVIPSQMVPQPSSLPVGLVDALVSLGVLFESPNDSTPTAPDVCILSDASIADNRAGGYLAATLLIGNGHQKQQCLDAFRGGDIELASIQCTRYPGHVNSVHILARELAKQAYCQASSTVEEDTKILRKLQSDDSKQSIRKAIAVKFRLEEKKTLFKAGQVRGAIQCSADGKNLQSIELKQ